MYIHIYIYVYIYIHICIYIYIYIYIEREREREREREVLCTCAIVLGGTSVIIIGFGDDRKFKIGISCLGLCYYMSCTESA